MIGEETTEGGPTTATTVAKGTETKTALPEVDAVVGGTEAEITTILTTTILTTTTRIHAGSGDGGDEKPTIRPPGKRSIRG